MARYLEEMATTDRAAPARSSAESPTSTQPGGYGFCTKVEQLWAFVRRAWLRRVRPGYVRRMAAKRQGSCANCPHDIIDARDLKFCRTACGYWFRPEDDHFRWRDHLGLARDGLAEVVLGTLLFLLLAVPLSVAAALLHWAFWMPLAALLACWLWLVSFFRDPERRIPADPAALVSPADGTVTHVGEVPDLDFQGGRAFCVSIFLSIFNVHVNRTPVTGRVTALRYFRGAFLDARHAQCAVRNEQLWIDLEQRRTGRLVRVKQIAGAIARRIVCRLKPGDEVQAGGRFGMIKFGSRTEVLIAAGEAMDVTVKVGDKVKGGSTVLLRCRS